MKLPIHSSILQVLLFSCSRSGILIIGSAEPGADAPSDHEIEEEPSHDDATFDDQEDEAQDVVVDDADMDEDGRPADGNPEDIVVGDCVGDACSTDDQCECVPSVAHECTTSIYGYASLYGGYCSARCTTSSECGESGRCVEVMTGYSMCLKHCSLDGECRTHEGYECSVLYLIASPDTYCLPGWYIPENDH